MRAILLSSSIFAALFFLSSATVSAQLSSPVGPPQHGGVKADPSPSPSPAPPSPKPSLEKHFIQHIVHDQAAIWTAPFKLHNYDSKWSAPLALGMGALIATDRNTSRWIQQNGDLPVISRDVSWFGKAYTTGGVAAAFYLTGRFTHNAKARETGILAAEALIDTGIVTRVLKAASRRARPNVDDGSAEFWDGGDSFPSGHASTVWSVATVIAYEYKDNRWIKYGAFAAATAVRMSRYSGRNHFLSDIAAGSALGFLIGRYVVHRYHDPAIDLPKSKSTTLLRPDIVPYFDGRSHTYGGSVTWHL